MWSRPILKRSASYRAMEITRKAYHGNSQAQSMRALMDSQSQSQSQDSGRRNVSIPQPVMGGFKIAPQSSLGGAGGGAEGEGGAAGLGGGDERFRAAAASRDRLNAFKRKVKEGKRR